MTRRFRNTLSEENFLLVHLSSGDQFHDDDTNKVYKILLQVNINDVPISITPSLLKNIHYILSSPGPIPFSPKTNPKAPKPNPNQVSISSTTHLVPRGLELTLKSCWPSTDRLCHNALPVKQRHLAQRPVSE